MLVGMVRCFVMVLLVACSSHKTLDDAAVSDALALDSGVDASGADTGAADVGVDAPVVDVRGRLECVPVAGTSVSFESSAGTFTADGAFASHGGHVTCAPRATLRLLEGERIVAAIELELGERGEDGFEPWIPPFEQEVVLLAFVEDYGISYTGLLRIDEISTDYELGSPISFRGEIMIDDEGDRVFGRFDAAHCPSFDSVPCE